MRVFKEEQRFDQWWLYVILLIPLAGVLLPIFVNNGSEETLNKGLYFGLAVMAIIYPLILTLKLRTKIDQNGIDAKFTPLTYFHKHFDWSEIAVIKIRKYSAITEYGGYGIRGIGKTAAYNVKGNRGIQIVTKSGRKFLIGTQNPMDAQKVINFYQKKDY